MRFRDYFTNNFETGENHYIPSLRTRYYRCRNEDAKDAVKQVIKEEKGKIKAILDEHHEIFFHAPQYTSTITVISPRISETAVDIKITTYKLLPRGLGKKIIERIYKKIDSKLPFKGVGLYKE